MQSPSELSKMEKNEEITKFIRIRILILVIAIATKVERAKECDWKMVRRCLLKPS